MRRGRVFFLLALIVLLCLVAVVLVVLRLRPAITPQPSPVGEPTPQVVDTVNVLVATQKIPRGGVISRDVVSLIPIQRQFYLQGMFSEIKDVEGRLAKIDIEAGLIILESMLAGSAEELSATGSDIALYIPRGSVAVAIPIERLTKASFPVQAGDRVNVAVVHSFVDIDTEYQTKLPNVAGEAIAPGTRDPAVYLTAGVSAPVGEGSGNAGRAETVPGLGQPIVVVPAEPQRPRLVAQVILQDVTVLSVGTYEAGFRSEAVSTPAQQPPEQGPQPPTQPTPQAPKPAPEFVSLIVTPQDALMLTYLMANGAQFTLHLRAAGDNSRVQIEAQTLQYYLNRYNVPVPVKLPYGIEPRVDSPNMPNITFQPTPTPIP
ncbi:MAG: SAF domain-containing protein [Anaerolineales bacterium]|nr:SAF domain-containing protein [Anaerolineales bacterium]MDW8160864.1 SAF domain-containing protein [Anaerolineales bacterium]